MPAVIRVGLIGDRDPAVPAHQAIPRALALAAEVVGVGVAHEWVPTEEITADSRVGGYDALWCVPASPYRSTDGALRAVALDGHPFFVATLFQPERAALRGELPPIVAARANKGLPDFPRDQSS